MKMVKVKSSAIRYVGYNPVTGDMKIAFIQGDTYDFCGVPPHIYESLLTAPSKGTYYHDYIRDRYQCY